MKWFINMAKKSIRQLKKLLRLQEKQLQLQSLTSQDNKCINIQDLIVDLVSVDTMLCKSSVIASQQYKEDSKKLLEIIKNHHVGLEVSLTKLGINIYRSKPGVDFDPEIMQAHSALICTDNPKLHGKVAISVSPRFVLAQTAESKETLLQIECVMLYKFTEG